MIVLPICLKIVSGRDAIVWMMVNGSKNNCRSDKLPVLLICLKDLHAARKGSDQVMNE